jgi:hypothetical protein
MSIWGSGTLKIGEGLGPSEEERAVNEGRRIEMALSVCSILEVSYYLRLRVLRSIEGMGNC